MPARLKADFNDGKLTYLEFQDGVKLTEKTNKESDNKYNGSYI